jgi:hypothetical protein
MAQRDSGYERRDLDHYPTPAWVVEALAEHVDLQGKGIWEPACGTGEMCQALVACGAAYAHGTDIAEHGYPYQHAAVDFTQPGNNSGLIHYDGIVTNPPYGERGKLAEQFILSGLQKMGDYGFLALLLPSDFDHAKTRYHLFGDCPWFAGKIVLTKRIKWFDGPASPSANHAWFVWQHTWIGKRQTPQIWYAPTKVTS